MRKIVHIFLIFTAYSAFAQTAGGSSDNNINNIVNDIRNNPIDLSVRKYNLTSLDPVQMNRFSDSRVLKGWTDYRSRDNYRNIKGYGSQFLMIQYFNFSWYNVNRFVFKKIGMFLDNGIVIGDDYDKIKRLNIPFGEYEYPVYKNDKLLFSGDKFDPHNFFVNDTVLIFNENKILIEIHINFAKVNIDKDISKILINEWKTYPTHYPQWKLLFSNDNTFSFTYKLKTEDEYIINKGIWRLIFDNDYPKVELIFNDEKEFNGRYKIDELQENEFRIDFGSIYFFYPYTFNYP
jgi:hypothetical protein